MSVPSLRLLLVVAVAALFVVAAPARADFKDLKVLPKTISKDDLKATMKAQAKALGVDCDHCHDMPDAEKDTAHKKTARQMMQMVKDLNTKYLKGMDKKVTCDTCHRGHEEPEVTGK